MQSGLKVFISSTGKDLEMYRQAAIDVCNELLLIPIGMEYFEAMGKGATAGSKFHLDKADVYVGIFAHRYGYIEKGYKRSVTEIEYDYAGEQSLERLCFLIDPNQPWLPENFEFNRQKELIALKNKVDLEIRNYFTSVDNFKHKLSRALIGWISRWEEAYGGKLEPILLLDNPIIKASTQGYEFGNDDVTISKVSSDLVDQLDQDLGGMDNDEKELISSGPNLLKELLSNFNRAKETSINDENFKKLIYDHSLTLYNQQKILKNIRILKQRAQVIELSGPSGIGKTHILKTICNEEDLDQLSEPNYGKGETLYLCASAQNDWKEIMGDFIRDIGGEYNENGNVTDQLSIILMEKYLQRRFKRAFFIIDQVDKIKDDVLISLLGDDGPLGNNLRENIPLMGDVPLVLIFACRRPRLSTLPLKNKNLRIHLLQIDPLPFEEVRMKLEDNLPPGLAKDEDVIPEMAREIYNLTNGHPGAINIIIKGLENSKFAVSITKFQEKFRPLILRMVQQEIIGDMKLKEYLLLNVLSIFRSFHFPLIDRLLNYKLLPNDLLDKKNPSSDDYRAWLDRMCETPALIRKAPENPHHPYKVNSFIRHVLTMDLEVLSKEQFSDLHLHAFQIYNTELTRKDSNDIRLKSLSRTTSGVYS